jgi:hypothetical protein
MQLKEDRMYSIASRDEHHYFKSTKLSLWYTKFYLIRPSRGKPMTYLYFMLVKVIEETLFWDKIFNLD